MPRTERALVQGASEWLKAERARLGWSVENLIERIHSIAEDFTFGDALPNMNDVEALERAEGLHLPLWLRLAHYAIEHAAQPGNPERLAWVGSRNWFHAAPPHPFDACHALLFVDEYRFLEELGQMGEARRRALRRFTTQFWRSRSDKERNDHARRFLSEFDIDLTDIRVEGPEEKSLLDRFATMSPRDRKVLLHAAGTMADLTSAVSMGAEE